MLVVDFSNTPFEEGDLWEIFHCLARGAHVLRYQALDNTSKPQATRTGAEVCHFDLKPWNGTLA